MTHRSILPLRRASEDDAPFVVEGSLIVEGRPQRVKVHCGPAKDDEVPVPPGWAIKRIEISRVSAAEKAV